MAMAKATDIEQAVEALTQEVAASNVLLAATQRELLASRVETAVRVEGLRAEQNRERRTRMMLVAAGGLSLIYLDGQYAAHCSPGARLEDVIKVQEQHPKIPQKTLQAMYDHPSSETSCDIAMPFNTHSNDGWPTPSNGIGFALIAVVALGVVMFHRLRTVADFRNVEKAARMEDPRASRSGSDSGSD